MNGGSDDVGQSLGLPDFVDPADVGHASLDASQTWGEERAASYPTPDDSTRFGSTGAEVSSARPSSRQASGARAARRDSWGERSARSASGRGGPGSSKRAKKYLTWAEKAERKEKRAQARRAAEAAEREKDPMGFAREIVLTQLAAMPRSRAQLAQKLRDKEVSEDVIDAVLDRMEDVGLVDDEAYAAMLVRSQVASRGLARRALRQELSRKGIDEETAAVALEVVDDDTEREQALVLARKKLATMTRLDMQTQTRRLAGLLARKGYSGSLVWSVIKEVQGEVDADVDVDAGIE